MGWDRQTILCMASSHLDPANPRCQRGSTAAARQTLTRTTVSVQRGLGG